LARFFHYVLDVPPSTCPYTLPLHDALPISFAPRFRCSRADGPRRRNGRRRPAPRRRWKPSSPPSATSSRPPAPLSPTGRLPPRSDRKSTRLNSSHVKISYAVFCLKKPTAVG